MAFDDTFSELYPNASFVPPCGKRGKLYDGSTMVEIFEGSLLKQFLKEV